MAKNKIVYKDSIKPVLSLRSKRFCAPRKRLLRRLTRARYQVKNVYRKLIIIGSHVTVGAPRERGMFGNVR